MATEALAADQTTEEHVEEVKLIDDIKTLEGKDEENLKDEDSTGGEAPANESEAANVGEENQGKEETAAEEVKKEETEDNNASDALIVDAMDKEAASKQEADFSTADTIDETDSSANKEPTVHSEQKELKDQVDVTDVSEPPKQFEKAGDSETTLMQEPASETAQEPAVPGAADEEVTTTPEAAEVNSVSDVVLEEVNSTPEETAEEATSSTPEAAAVEVTTTPEAATNYVTTIPEAAAEEVLTTSDIASKEVITTPEAVAEEVTTPAEVATEEVTTTPEAAAKELITTPEAAVEEVNATPGATTEKVDATVEPSQVSSVSLTEGKEAEPAVVSTVTDPSPDDIAAATFSETEETSRGGEIISDNPENTESVTAESLVTDSTKLDEVSESVPETVVSESADAGTAEAAPVTELKNEEKAADTEGLTESAEGVISTITSPVIESIEGLVKPEDKDEEAIQEKAVVAEEPSAGDVNSTDTATQVIEVSSEGSAGVGNVEKEASEEGGVESSKDLASSAEVTQEKASEVVENKKDGSLESANATVVETTRDIVGEGDKNATAEGEKTAEDNEQTPVESTKDAGEAPKEETPPKSSKSQSNNIFSKVKHSIVKVKKAIIGKSPSSKTMSAS